MAPIRQLPRDCDFNVIICVFCRMKKESSEANRSYFPLSRSMFPIGDIKVVRSCQNIETICLQNFSDLLSFEYPANIATRETGLFLVLN